MATLLREAVGNVLRRMRMEQHLTLREVSDSARVSLGYLSEVERGRKEPSSELLNAICGALQVPLATVLFDIGTQLTTDHARGALTETEVLTDHEDFIDQTLESPRGTSLATDIKLVIPQQESGAYYEHYCLHLSSKNPPLAQPH